MEESVLYNLIGVSKRFKMTNGYVEVLHDLNLKIEGGKWVALVGRSGCGKTTLLHLLGGLDRPTAGKLLLDGDDLATMSQSKLTALRLKRIGVKDVVVGVSGGLDSALALLVAVNRMMEARR